MKNRSELETQIERRLQSEAWNQEIASKVVARRSKNLRKLYLRSGTGGFLAAIFLVLFMFVFQNNTPGEYDLLIVSQINGTVESVYGEENKLSVYEFDDNSQTDQLIETSLALR